MLFFCGDIRFKMEVDVHYVTRILIGCGDRVRPIISQLKHVYQKVGLSFKQDQYSV